MVLGLHDAKSAQRQIVVSWIDLANAYGCVRHNLIQFALNWYHVPIGIQSLIFQYYEILKATVVTNEWSTGFFLFDIGLFQGCVLSAILFDCVFQLLLDLLSPQQKLLGYAYKCANIRKLSSAYADDLAITTKTPQGNQKALDITDRWLDWTGTMAAKPKKCVALACRKFYAVHKYKLVPFSDNKSYSAYDPQLVIKGQPVGFIVNPKQKDPFKQLHFKFLGTWIHWDLSKQLIKDKIRDIFLNDMDRSSRITLEKCSAVARTSRPFTSI